MTAQVQSTGASDWPAGLVLSHSTGLSRCRATRKRKSSWNLGFGTGWGRRRGRAFANVFHPAVVGPFLFLSPRLMQLSVNGQPVAMTWPKSLGRPSRRRNSRVGRADRELRQYIPFSGVPSGTPLRCGPSGSQRRSAARASTSRRRGAGFSLWSTLGKMSPP